MPASVPTPAFSSRLSDALAHAVRQWDRTQILRVEVPVAPADPLDWLSAQAGAPALYWRGRGEAEGRAAVGSALTVEADALDRLDLGDALDILPPGARLTLTARFDSAAQAPPSRKRAGEEWNAFGAVRAVLPRIEFRLDGRTAMLAVHLMPGEPASVAARALASVRPARPAEGPLPLPFMRRDDPDRAEWDRALRWSLGAFERGDFDKVVLARRARFTFDEGVDALALLRRLEAATPRCYHTLVAPDGLEGPAFICATPERLLRLDGRTLQTEAVAGTRPRSETDAADDRLRDELLASEKDRREHAYVRDAIRQSLAPLTETVETDADASAMTLARGRHLYTGVRARLDAEVGAVDVLRGLHPTPAVGGTPTLDALDAIDRLEPFDRGLYAGPLGWVGRADDGTEAADLAVGIRSGLVDGRSLSLYSGAGIVAGSDPAAEWAEIEHKIGDFARVLGLTDRAVA